MRPQHRPEGPDIEGRRKIVELDLVIAALQTFGVLFLVCGVYLATHRTGGSQISAEPASPAPARSPWRERAALADDGPSTQMRSGSAL